MGIEYKWANWRFDNTYFAACVMGAVRQHGLHNIAEMMGVDHSTVENWANDKYKGRKFNHPHMTNFLTFCNLTDCNPNEFFTIQDPL